MIRIKDLEHRLRAVLSENLSLRLVGRGVLMVAAAAALALMVALAALRVPALAADAGLHGVVRDASGATVPGARVVAAFTDSSRKEIAFTNDTGEFNLAPLPDGTYNVSVAKPGFALTDLRGIQVSGGTSQPLQVLLMPGKVHETVTIVGDGAAPPAASPGEPQRIRVGGNVQAVKLVRKVDPKYPPGCKAEAIQGSVVMRAVISREGDVLNLEVLNQIVDPRLVESAVDAVEQWKYQPTLLNGSPVEVVTEIDVNFVLKR
jgi:TonB family protein